MTIDKLKPALPAGHKWRKDYVLLLDPNSHKRRTWSGYFSLPAARKDALNLIREGSAKEVVINRYSESGVSIRPHAVEIIGREAA